MFTVAMVFMAGVLVGQPPSRYQKAWDHADDQAIYEVERAADGTGDFFVVGTTRDPDNGDWYAYVARFSGQGQMIWHRRLWINTNQDYEAYGAGATTDGGVLVVGRRFIPGADDRCFVFKLSSTGAVQWVQEFSSGGGDVYCFDAVELVGYSGGGPDRYVVVGLAILGGDDDVFVGFLDNNGNVTNQLVYDGNNSDERALAVYWESTAQALYVAGRRRPVGFFNRLFLMQIVDVGGGVWQKAWDQEYRVPNWDFRLADMTILGNYVWLAGLVPNQNRRILLRVDAGTGANPQLLWMTGGNNNNEWLWDIAPSFDNTRVVVVGMTEEYTGTRDVFVAEVDVGATMVHRAMIYNLNGDQEPGGILQDGNGYLIVFWGDNIGVGNDADYMLWKIDSFWNGGCNAVQVPVAYGNVNVSVNSNVLQIGGNVSSNMPNFRADMVSYVGLCACPITASFTHSVASWACVGDTVDFFGVGSDVNGKVEGLQFFWDFGPGAVPATSTVDSPQNVYWSSSGTKGVKMRVSDGLCTDSVIQSIVVHDTPTINIVAIPSTTVCEGSPIQFANNGSSGPGWSYQWSFDWGASPSTSTLDSPTVIYAGAGSREVTLTVSSPYCSGTDTLVIQVDSTPQVSFSYPPRVCEGENAQFQFTGVAASGATYAWTFEDGTPSSANTPSATAQFQGVGWKTVTLKVTNGNGCSAMDSVEVLVDSLPDVNIVAIPGNTVCEGSMIQFANNGTGGSGWTFQWSFDWGSSPSSSTLDSPIVVYSGAGQRIVSLTVSSPSCTNSDTLLVQIDSTPQVSFSYPSRVCEGENAQFQFTGVAASGATYAWTFEDGTPSSANTPSATVQFQGVGWKTVVLTVTNGNGCTASDSVELHVDSVPVVSFTVSLPVCAGDTVSFANTGTSDTVWTYQWWFGEGAVPVQATVENPTGIVYTYGGSKVVWLEIRNPHTGCWARDSMVIWIDTLPYANAGRDTTICYGTAVQLGTPPPAGTNYQYTWRPAETLDDPSAAQPTATPDARQTWYVVTVVDPNTGCRAMDSVLITMLPPLEVDAGPDVEICYGDTVQISAVFSDRYAFSWSPAMWISDPQVPDPYVWPETTTVYRITVTDTSIYQCGSAYDEVLVLVHPLPDARIVPDTDTIALGQEIQLVATGGVQYEWTPWESLNNAGIPDPIAQPETTTVYVVRVVDVYGCVNYDTAVIYVINPTVWVPNAFTPDGDGVSDEFRVMGSGFVAYELRIFDRWGNLVFWTREIGKGWDGTNYRNGQAEPPGAYVYWYYVKTSDGKEWQGEGIVNLIR